MIRTLLLATAMLLVPVAALASSNSSDRAKTIRPRATACTPLNPCAVPPPALDLPRSLAAVVQAEAQSPRRQAR